MQNKQQKQNSVEDPPNSCVFHYTLENWDMIIRNRLPPAGKTVGKSGKVYKLISKPPSTVKGLAGIIDEAPNPRVSVSVLVIFLKFAVKRTLLMR